MLKAENINHSVGGAIRKSEYQGVQEPPTVYGHIATEKVIIEDDLRHFLKSNYAAEKIFHTHSYYFIFNI